MSGAPSGCPPLHVGCSPPVEGYRCDQGRKKLSAATDDGGADEEDGKLGEGVRGGIDAKCLKGGRVVASGDDG